MLGPDTYSECDRDGQLVARINVHRERRDADDGRHNHPHEPKERVVDAVLDDPAELGLARVERTLNPFRLPCEEFDELDLHE